MAPAGTIPGLPVKAPNHDTRGPNIVACGVVLLVLSTISACIRVWSRVVASRKRFWWDDFWLLTTLVFSHLYLSMNIWGVSLGVGQHQWMVPMSKLKPNVLNLHLGLTFYGTAVTTMKLSALCLYARIFRVKTGVLLYLRVLGVFIIAWWAVLIVVPWTNCTPLRKSIDPLVPGTCTTRIPYYLTAGALNFVLDVVILLTPVPLILRLTLTRTKKVQLLAIFIVGYGSAFVSLARLIMIAKKPALLSAAPGSDPSWDTVPLLYASMLEAPLAIIALCGPPIHQFFRRAHSYGWRSLLSTKQYYSPPPSDKAPSFDQPTALGNAGGFGIIRKRPSHRSLDKSLLETQTDELSPPMPNQHAIETMIASRQRAGHQGEYLELHDLGGKAA